MSQWYNNPNVFIRSLATRGSLGGLHPKILEISDLLKAAPFDVVIIETVGVGQSEVEIAGLADSTIVVVVPESGDGDPDNESRNYGSSRYFRGKQGRQARR
jgi:LAO/AO transport system kinase